MPAPAVSLATIVFGSAARVIFKQMRMNALKGRETRYYTLMEKSLIGRTGSKKGNSVMDNIGMLGKNIRPKVDSQTGRYIRKNMPANKNTKIKK